MQIAFRAPLSESGGVTASYEHDSPLDKWVFQNNKKNARMLRCAYALYFAAASGSY
jgi:hypothetical protein